jgi:hypothetical protein
VGGSIQYTYYTALGHLTWNSEYAKADFFSWFLARKKNQPAVLFEQPLACPGDPVNVRIGLSRTINPNGLYGGGNNQRIINYQWAKGNTNTIVASGATLNEIVVNSNPSSATNTNCTPGVYYGRFQRADLTWTDWSDPITITDTRGPSVTPVISANGKSTTLPSLDGGTEVLLSGPSDKAVYQWKRNDGNISGASDFRYNASLAGAYTLISKDPAGNPFQFEQVPTEFRPPTQGCFSNRF